MLKFQAVVRLRQIGGEFLRFFDQSAVEVVQLMDWRDLGGAIFALLYFQSGMRLERFVPSASMLENLQPKPKLRVHDPDEPDETEEAVDEILKKIQEHGRDSLTRRERRILEEASREYQKRRH